MTGDGRILPLRADGPSLAAARHGAKACGLQDLLRLGLAVPDGFVVPIAEAEEIAAGISPDRGSGVVTDAVSAVADAIDELLGDADRSSTRLAVRSGAEISLPGAFETLLDVLPAVVPEAIATVVDSTRGLRVETLVRAMGVDRVPPTAVVVQRQVDATADDRSGAGVAMSCDPVTGEAGMTGSIAWGIKGDAVMAGTVPVESIATVDERCPEVAAQLRADAARVADAVGSPVELEFAIERGRLWYVQLRTFVLPEASGDGDPVGKPADVIARGRPASPGIASGALYVDVDAAIDRIDAGDDVILALETSSPGDVPIMVRAAGVLTVLGSPESHAAVVTRGAEVPAIVSVQGLELTASGARFGGRDIAAGTTLTIDGRRGLVWVSSP